MIKEALNKQVTLYFKNSALTFSGVLVELSPIVIKSNSSIFVVEDDSCILGYIISNPSQKTESQSQEESQSEEEDLQVEFEKAKKELSSPQRLDKLSSLKKMMNLEEAQKLRKRLNSPPLKQSENYSLPNLGKK